MTVEELIERLKELPPTLPVQLKIYGCGQESWVDLEEIALQDMVNDKNTRICEIDAAYN